ncbi:RNA 2'-phosphotransferase [Phycisphaeraceae bacterium D3-23]
MNENEQKQVSKTLSYVLRHRPDSIGLTLGEGGWVQIDELLNALAHAGKRYTPAMLDRVVAENDKQRFELSEDGQGIRARQGHSVEVDLAYAPVTPPDVLFHGTADRSLESIFAKGLDKGRRHHVHLSTNRETMRAVGMRHGIPVILRVDAAGMYRDGFSFFVSGNSVWLTDHVPRKYLSMDDGH